jgi:hypothetical protein
MRDHFGYNEYDYDVGMAILLVREPQGYRLGKKQKVFTKIALTTSYSWRFIDISEA